MYAKSVLRLLAALCLLFAAHSATAQSDFLPENFYSYKLENGLELYVQEDFTVPALKVEYVTKAGTARQQKDTAGFFRLYSALFWQNAVPGIRAYEREGALGFSAECASSQSRYGFTVPVQSFEKVLALFASALKQPKFFDSAIRNEFESLKSESASYASSAGGFINAAVDAQVLSRSPWKKDSFLQSALFAKMNTEAARQKLSRIARIWYVPNQSALFVSGPLDAQTVLDTVKKELSDWEYAVYSPPDTSRIDALQAPAAPKTSDAQGGRFVLVSDDFSKDFNQALIQYTAPAFGSGSPHSAAAWAAAEILQQKQNLRAMPEGETDVSFSADGADSRISVQALFPASLHAQKDNPADNIEELLNAVNKAVQNISEGDLTEAQTRARFLQSQALKGPESFIRALSANWAYGGAEYFFEWPKSVQSLTLQQVTDVFTPPWIFLFVHTSQYNLYEKRFTKDGWTLIKQGKKSAGASSAQAPKNQPKNQSEADGAKPERTNAAEAYAAYTESLAERFTLSSGIRVSVQKLPNTAWVCFILNIRGGELKYGFEKKGLESLAVQNLAQTLRQKIAESPAGKALGNISEIETNTELFSARLSFTCPTENLPLLTDFLSASLQKNDVSLAQADELYFTEAFNRRSQDISPDNQLQKAAMETFFGAGASAPLFASADKLLPSVTYDEIRNACLSLYDPENIDIILCGDVPQHIRETLESSFGKEAVNPLSEQHKIAYTKTSFEPAFTEGEQTVRLRHVFLSDIPADQAGERPAKLIPTTDFSDPALLYLKSPEFGTKEAAVFSALMHEIAERLTQKFQSAQNAPARSARAHTDAEPFFLASLYFSKVKSKSRLQKAYKDCLREFSSELKELQKPKPKIPAQDFCDGITGRYAGSVSHSFMTLESRADLIRQGAEYADNPSYYIEQLRILGDTGVQDFESVFSAYIEKAKVFWLFSADTKR